ncbi:hypothetical protein BDQ17DRAFT_1363710 [Cyathus striatus]|nr:hypothetical protein BDQ17DRAFT_1363710 [Cyathus striatus]
MASPIIPLHDLAELIVKHIHDNADLKSCSLASRLFTPYCQRRLLSALNLWHQTETNAKQYLDNLRSIAAKNPRLLSYFRIIRLNLNVYNDKKWSIAENPSDLAFLEKLSSIEELKFHGGRHISSGSADFHRFMCKTLSHTSLRRVEGGSYGNSGFTWSLLYFVHMLHVQDLQLHQADLEVIDHSHIEDLLSNCPISKYSNRKNLRALHTGGSANEIVDALVILHDSPNTNFELSHIEELQVDPTSTSNVESIWQLMRRCSRSLRKLSWWCDSGVDEYINIPIHLGVFPNLQSMEYAAMGDIDYPLKMHLKHLHVVLSSTSCSSVQYFTVESSTGDTTGWKSYVRAFKNDWRVIDEDLSNKKLFPKLQHVKFGMDIFRGFDRSVRHNYDISWLMRTCFPLLSSMEDVKLDMAIV